METDLNWQSLINEALEQLRGDAPVPIVGAKLRQALAFLVARQGQDLTNYLQSHGLSFSQLLEQNSPDLVLIRRPSTDMLVLKSGEPIPSTVLEQTSSGVTPLIRSDFYMAFTDFSTGLQYFYNTENDQVLRFNNAAALENKETLISLPPASYDEQIALRGKFADAHNLPALRLMLTDTTHALRTFQVRVRQLGLDNQWHEFKYDALKNKLIEWASKNSLQVRPEWFVGSTARRQPDLSIGSLLKYFADHMSEDELKELKIPLRAVHEFWVAQIRSKRDIQ